MSKSNTALAQLPSYKDIGSTGLAASVVRSLTRGGDFLDRLQLYQGSSSEAKKSKIPIGHWGIPSRDAVDDLGKEVEIIVFAYRAKGLDTSKTAVGGKAVVNYDPDSATFKSIAERSSLEGSNCMSGLEFLVYERSTNKWLTYFAYSKSAQFIAEDLIPDPNEGPLQVTLKAEYMEGVKKGSTVSWHAPTVKRSNTPFTTLPTLDEAKAQVEKFISPPKSEDEATEVTAEQAKAVSGRRR
jgi:hypothetical protein